MANENDLLHILVLCNNQRAETLGGGALKWQEGYQARPWSHKKHPNHVFFMYENSPGGYSSMILVGTCR